MFIILLIIVSIIILETYILIRNFPVSKESKFKLPIIIEKTKNSDLLDEYSVKDESKIQHKPGKIMINRDYNLFISTDSYNTLMKKDYIYTIDSPFELEILNLADENIIYYYKQY